MNKFKVFMINFAYMLFEIIVLIFLFNNYIKLFSLNVWGFIIIIFIVRIIMFRVYALFNLIKYLISFRYNDYNILKFSHFTRLWYLDDCYLKGVIIIPISQDAKRIVCNTSVHYQPLGPKYSRPSSYFIFDLYDRIFSGMLAIHPIAWDLNETMITKSLNNIIKVSRHKKYRLVKSMLLKMDYSDGTVEYQKDFIDDFVKWNDVMESVYGKY